MSADVAIVTLHGMGEQEPGYSTKKFEPAIRKRLGADSARVSWHEVFYAGTFDANEMRVWRLMEPKVRWRTLHRFVLMAFGDAVGLEDRPGEPNSEYTLTQIEVAQKLWAAKEAMDRHGPVVVAAYSLGCQVFSCYLWDARGWRSGGGQKPAPYGIWANPTAYARNIFGAHAPSEADWAFVAGQTVAAFHTVGCNIPVFVSAHPEERIVPFERPNDGFEWHNFYEKDDLLGWPLKPLSRRYDAIITSDNAVAAGGFFSRWFGGLTPYSHLQYWDTAVVQKKLVELTKAQLRAPELASPPALAPAA